MMTKRILRLALQALLLLALSACGSPATSEPFPFEPYVGNEPNGGKPEPLRISMPSSSQIAPSDVLDQVTFEGTGGGEGGEWCPCVYVEGTTLYLKGFSSNQTVRLVAYDEYKQYYGDYYADWLVEVDTVGFLAISVNGYQRNFTFIAYNPTTGKQIGPMNRRVFPNEEVVSSTSSSAQISFEVEEVNLRMSPGYSNKDDSRDVITKIPAGETVEILSGPFLADGLNWWAISWKGQEGYVADHTGSGRAILVFNP